MVAAGFSPGEADQLRRSMAAWHRDGDIHRFEQRLIDGMRERGYSEAFARRIFQQIVGFGEYGFPESHAASFALLAYVSAWLKCHQPAAFTCALLNSQPMGFYAPVQLVQDARRHGVEVRPVDVLYSDWDCRLEPPAGLTPRQKDTPADTTRPAPGPTYGQRDFTHGAERLIGVRKKARPSTVSALLQQARLNTKDLNALADADALQGLGNRHQAHWQTLGIETPLPMITGDHGAEATPPATPAYRGRRHHRRLCRHRSHPRPPPHRPAPPTTAQATFSQRRTDPPPATRPADPYWRPGDHPSTSRHRHRRGIFDPGRRDRPHQRGGLEPVGATTTTGITGRQATRRLWPSTTRRQGDPRDRTTPKRPCRTAGRAGHAVAGFSLIRGRLGAGHFGLNPDQHINTNISVAMMVERKNNTKGSYSSQTGLNSKYAINIPMAPTLAAA